MSETNNNNQNRQRNAKKGGNNGGHNNYNRKPHNKNNKNNNEKRRSDYRKPNRFEYRNRPKKRDVETVADIANDIKRIEKEIQLEIKEITQIRLGV